MTRALAIVCLAALGGGLSVAAQQSPEPVFTTLAPATVRAAERTAPTRGVAARTVVGMRLDRLFAAPRVTLNVDGHDWIAAVEEINGTVNEHRAWVGSIEGIPYSHVSVVERAGVVSGLINAVGVTYTIRTLSPGLYTLDRMLDRIDDLGPVIWHPEARAPSARAAGSVIVADDAPSFVDVLLLYTPAARDDVGGNAQMAAVIAQVISDSNTIFNRSGIGMRLRLVGASELAYIETSNIAVDLAALSANAAVNALRDSLGADVVQLLEFGADLSACGVGYLYQGTIPSEFPAFSVSAIDCVSQYTPTHEIGHVMGSHHNPEQAGGTPLFPYSYGYRDAASPYPFRTVMSYICPSVNCPRIASFSNPNVAHQDNGRPTGGPLQNNALSINNAAPLVANFRPTKQPAGSCSYAVTPPWLSFAPGAATAAITITTQAGCSWTATLGAAWTNVTPASGTGTTTLTVSVAANDTNSDRAASVVIEGVAVSVKQSGPCTLALTPSALMFEPVAGEQTLAIETAAGCTWTTSSDASWLSVSPPSGSGAAIVIVQAVNNAGRPRVGTITVAGSTATVTQASPLPLVATPIDLREVGALGDRVTLAWTAGVGQLDATGYLVEGGLSPGDVMGSLPTGSNSPAVTFYAPTGALYLRVRAVAGANLSPPSNEIRVFVNVPPPPSAPANLLGLIHGDRAFLSWTPTAYGGAATAFQINVTGNVTDSFVISGPTETFAVSGVPPGNYAVSVVALNPQGVSPPSPTIALQVPSPCAAPQAPTNVQVMQIQRVLSVLWDPPVAGSAITHYAVRVSGAAQGVLQTIERAVSQEVSPGRYTVRVTAVNSCGVGVSSPERTVIVP